MKHLRQPVPDLDPALDRGLSNAQAAQRKEAGWDNLPQESALPTGWQIAARHCFTFFNLVFLVLAAILVLVRSSVLNFGFLGVVAFNTAIGVVQELRAKRAVEKLTLVAEQTLKTLRGGKFLELRSRDLVLGDLVQFSAGAQICADAVVRRGSLQVDESLITGEADPVEKQEGDELMSGSFVVAGRGLCQLIRVGPDSYAAKLAAQAKKDPRAAKSRMMAQLEQLLRVMSVLLVPLGVLYFIGEFTTPGVQTQLAAEQTVAAMVSLIPQGLYLLTSVAMAVSAIALSRRRVLVRDLSCIETLARVDVLCLDKTGTLTQPGMAVEELIPLGGASHAYLEAVLGALFSGEPENDTARALAELYGRGSDWQCLRRVPFTSQAKWSGAVFARQGAFAVGAPECILGSRYPELAPLVEQWSAQGCRVLLVAGCEGALEDLAPDRVTPLALVTLRSPIRPEAERTLQYFARQGVSLKVISGDSPVTAAQVAGRAGITGESVDAQTLRPEDLPEAVEKYAVFGRVTPDKKQALVAALQKNKHTVAMVGDGVNDVLAMRQADCAVALAGGAQAASQVAKLVLVDSDFAAMPRIVDEGRRVVNNIQRAAALFLVKTVFTLCLVLTALFTPIVFPFQPITLTVIMALTVGIPGLFFALEPNYERFRGDFLAGAFRRALPAGLAGFASAVLAQVLAEPFGLDAAEVATACACAQALVGLLVLARVSRPLTRLRRWVLAAVGAALVGAFLLPGGLFGIDLYAGRAALMGAFMLLVGAGAYFALEWLVRRLWKP